MGDYNYEKFTVVGKHKGKFVDPQTGQTVNYAKLYVYSNVDGVEGVKAEALKCSGELLDSVNVGDTFSPIYSRYGRLVGLHLLGNS